MTNAHVCETAPVVSLVTEHGDREVVVKGTREWQHHPSGDDIALCYLGAREDCVYRYIGRNWFLSPGDLARDARPWQVGPGDEVLLIGRYMNDRSVQLDQPLVRFGNVAMLPERVRQTSRGGFEQESFLVDMRSQPGLSGSLVLVYFGDSGVLVPDSEQAAFDRGDWTVGERLMAVERRQVITKFWVLGINWGRLPLRADFRTADGEVIKAEANHGLAAVVPAWKLSELLDSHDVATEREAAEMELRRLGPD